MILLNLLAPLAALGVLLAIVTVLFKERSALPVIINVVGLAACVIVSTVLVGLVPRSMDRLFLATWFAAFITCLAVYIYSGLGYAVLHRTVNNRFAH
jgi:ABC-type Fe3+-siderophore transport system permease subunit